MHISYVRSVNMDEWKPKELKKMQLGGNSKMNSFLKKYGVLLGKDCRRQTFKGNGESKQSLINLHNITVHMPDLGQIGIDVF